ncbi:2-dehydropantoate 2-reductase [Neorhizobium galegae]|uniref:ketopantoate reductase family protein n=1 Tax=Neorhizobium galegae TaxID=399 RepID=UPI002784E69E|nr:2-dehydropantoate 2-reductase [Neorhizobium galegae]MDQ0137806.1 2-dehydropantoate 2-reductase [Neorhizobium galegae]
MRIAVIGAGAMGGLFAARLSASGQDVALIEVAPAQIEAIEVDGLRMTCEAGETTYLLPIGAADRYTGIFDLLIVFTKGMHTEAALTAARHLIGPETFALTVQNGIGNVETIETFIPPDRIVMGMTNWPSTLVAPGHIRVPGDGQIRIWAADGTPSPRLRDICAMLDGAGLNCELDPAVEVAIWEKLAFNAALNSLAAAADLTVGEMADRQEARDIVFAIIDEVVAVAKARDLAVDVNHVRQSVEHAFANHRQHKPSMLQDRLAGRRMEIATITGAVSRAGKMLNVATPVTTTFANLLTIFDNAGPVA